MPRVPPDKTPPPPPTTPPTAIQVSEQRHQALAKHHLTREELQEYLADTLDPLSDQERGWIAAHIECSGDYSAMSKLTGLTETAIRGVLRRPRMRRALNRSLGNIASPEAIVADMVDIGMGDPKVGETWEDGSPKRYEWALKLRALEDLARIRSVIVDRYEIRGISEGEAELDRLLQAELGRVRGDLPGTAQVVDAEVVSRTDAPAATPDTDPAGEEPNIAPSD
jgi:hypothetical protein